MKALRFIGRALWTVLLWALVSAFYLAIVGALFYLISISPVFILLAFALLMRFSYSV